MKTFLEWAILAGVIFWLWRWWGAGAHANLNIGPGQSGWGMGIPSTGYAFQGPGLVFGFDPRAWSTRQQNGGLIY